MKSSKGDGFAKCTLCQSDISIKSGGRNDVERHVKSKKHLEADKLKSTVKCSVDSFFKPTPGEEAVTTAEMSLRCNSTH